MFKDEILEKIKKNIIKRPILRKGEVYSGNEIYLYIYNENKKDMNMSQLFDTLEDGVEFYSNKLPKGTYYIYSKEQANPLKQKWNIELNI